MNRNGTFYGAKDPRELPAYGVPEASHYLLIPPATLRSWVVGRPYPIRSGTRYFQPVILAADPKAKTLSFLNMVEAHVLDAIRRKHHIELNRVRIAIEYLKKQLGSKHPLAEHRFETDGVDLFIEKFGQLINITRAGQTAMRQLIEAYLKRIDRDDSGVAIRLYPFTRKRTVDEPRAIVIDPLVSFGRPTLAGSGVATAVIAERYKAGESVEELAADYRRERLEIEEAIRCELELEAA